jgi:hypothetical protein
MTAQGSTRTRFRRALDHGDLLGEREEVAAGRHADEVERLADRLEGQLRGVVPDVGHVFIVPTAADREPRPRSPKAG